MHLRDKQLHINYTGISITLEQKCYQMHQMWHKIVYMESFQAKRVE